MVRATRHIDEFPRMPIATMANFNISASGFVTAGMKRVGLAIVLCVLHGSILFGSILLLTPISTVFAINSTYSFLTLQHKWQKSKSVTKIPLSNNV